jgi:hypothetical protein
MLTVQLSGVKFPLFHDCLCGAVIYAKTDRSDQCGRRYVAVFVDRNFERIGAPYQSSTNLPAVVRLRRVLWFGWNYARRIMATVRICSSEFGPL